MSLEYPDLVERTDYNLLCKVRDYRAKYGRDFARYGSSVEPDAHLDPHEADRTISKAIAHLESIHNTNEWGLSPFRFDTNGNVEIIWDERER